MKSRPTPANLYTTRRIGLKHWLDPESKTLFSQGRYRPSCLEMIRQVVSATFILPRSPPPFFRQTTAIIFFTYLNGGVLTCLSAMSAKRFFLISKVTVCA